MSGGKLIIRHLVEINSALPESLGRGVGFAFPKGTAVLRNGEASYALTYLSEMSIRAERENFLISELADMILLQFLTCVNRSHFAVTPNDCFTITDIHKCPTARTNTFTHVDATSHTIDFKQSGRFVA